MLKRLPRKNFEWDSDLAYAVGLLTTDGSLSSDKRHVILTSTDYELLKIFRSCLKKQNAIGNNPPGSLSRKQAYRIQLGDVVFYEWLLKIGLYANKTLTLGKIKIADAYFPDFLRGHLDGDGSIIYFKDKYNTPLNEKYVYDRLFVYFISASRNHIEWLRDNIIRLKGLSGSFSTNLSKTQVGKSSIFRLKFSTKEAKILLNWIYYKPNLPCLQRKLAIVKPFLTFMVK